MKIVTSLLFLVIGAVVMFGAIEVGSADTPLPAELATPGADTAEHPYRPLVAQAETGSSRGPITIPAADTPATDTPTVAAPAPTSSSPPPVLTPQAEDIGVLTKLWKNGAFFSLACVGLYLGLVVWSKVDRKRAWYAATIAGGMALIIEGIRKGDTPTATSLFATFGPLTGVLIKGPGHS